MAVFYTINPTHDFMARFFAGSGCVRLFCGALDQLLQNRTCVHRNFIPHFWHQPGIAGWLKHAAHLIFYSLVSVFSWNSEGTYICLFKWCHVRRRRGSAVNCASPYLFLHSSDDKSFGAICDRNYRLCQSDLLLIWICAVYRTLQLRKRHAFLASSSSTSVLSALSAGSRESTLTRPVRRYDTYLSSQGLKLDVSFSRI